MKARGRYMDVLAANWHLGFTSFGGPPVQFQLVRLTQSNCGLIHVLLAISNSQSSFTKSSSKISGGSTSQWYATEIADKPSLLMKLQYQQVFAITQGLPGSASTKMLFLINTVHAGIGAGFISFFFFS